MHTIWPNGKTRKEELTRRLDRVEALLQAHRKSAKPLRIMCANHLADALGCLTKCLLDASDQALDAAEKAAEETAPEPARRKTFTLQDLEAIVCHQRASCRPATGIRKMAGHNRWSDRVKSDSLTRERAPDTSAILTVRPATAATGIEPTTT
jgi:hypothetical protein